MKKLTATPVREVRQEQGDLVARTDRLNRLIRYQDQTVAKHRIRSSNESARARMVEHIKDHYAS